MKYEEEVKRLEQIVQQMERGDLDIDQLTEQLKEAQRIIKSCKDKLTKTDAEIKQLLEG
jgi:exodeoxyribonuclease VII small subunit